MIQILLAIFLCFVSTVAYAAMPVNPSYVSQTGSGSACTLGSPCALSYANTNADDDDVVNLLDTGGTFTTHISPTNSGSSGHWITFQNYTGDTPVITTTNGITLQSTQAYIKIDGVTFYNCSWGARIEDGSNHIEITNCTFYNNQTSSGGLRIDGDATDNFVTHVWVHGNTLHTFYGNASGCTDDGVDIIKIGEAQGAYGNTVCNNNYNTIEDNIIYHAGHAGLDNYGMYNVIKNNVFHNEPWSSGCSSYTNTPDYDDASYDGKFGHRNFQITEDYNRTATYVLVEGNRSGYAGVNPTNDGADNFSLAAPQNIVRYNAFYNSMNPGLLFKYNWNSGLNNGGHGGTYNRVYNNTFYNNGYGYPWAYTCGLSTCPWPQTNISLYTTASGLGNVVKNNLMYLCSGYTHWTLDVMEKGAPSNGWDDLGAVSYNWCTGAQSSSGGCSNYGDPLFVNPNTSDVTSLTNPDLHLQAGSGAINGGTYLTTATNSGSSSTTLTVADALYFQDGTWGASMAQNVTMFPDWIAIGTVGNVVQISAVTYGTYDSPAGTITLASPKTWSNGASIWLYKDSDGTRVLQGSAPDQGAFEYVPGTVTGVTCTSGAKIQ